MARKSNVLTRTISDLPAYLYYDIDDEGMVKTHRFFLSLNRDITGKWSCGYVCYADDGEIAIPELVLNNIESLDDAYTQMNLKLIPY